METINGARPINSIITENAKSELICVEIGLTKREYFAGLAMQSLAGLERQSSESHSKDVASRVAIQAVFFADELLKQLEKK